MSSYNIYSFHYLRHNYNKDYNAYFTISYTIYEIRENEGLKIPVLTNTFREYIGFESFEYKLMQFMVDAKMNYNRIKSNSNYVISLEFS